MLGQLRRFLGACQTERRSAERSKPAGSTMIARIPKWLRWILFLPVSLAAGFLVAGLIHLVAAGEANASGGALAYAAAFLSGLGYVWVALYTAHTVAPAHKGVVATVLGILILGDLSVVHLVLPSDLIQTAAEGDLGVILRLLRADDYSGLQNGGVVKVAGALTGLALAWWKHPSVEKRASKSSEVEDQESA